MSKPNPHFGFTLIEILLVAVILSIVTIGVFSLSLSYKQKKQLEVTSLNVASYIDSARQQSIISFEKQQHGIKISPSDKAFYHVTRANLISTPVTQNQILIPPEFSISQPASEQIIWFDKKTGFIDSTSFINQITLTSKSYVSHLSILPSGTVSVLQVTTL